MEQAGRQENFDSDYQNLEDYSLEKVDAETQADRVSYQVKTGGEVIGLATIEQTVEGYQLVCTSESEEFELPAHLRDLEGETYDEKGELIYCVENSRTGKPRESIFYESEMTRFEREGGTIRQQDLEEEDTDVHALGEEKTAVELLEQAAQDSQTLEELENKIEDFSR